MKELTPREDQVMHLVAHGYTNEEIADELGISHSTAKAHVSNALLKLHARNRVQAAITSGHLQQVARELYERDVEREQAIDDAAQDAFVDNLESAIRRHPSGKGKVKR